MDLIRRVFLEDMTIPDIDSPFANTPDVNTASYGDSMRLQYYVTTTDIDFISNAAFDSTVAATIMLGYKGRVK